MTRPGKPCMGLRKVWQNCWHTFKLSQHRKLLMLVAKACKAVPGLNMMTGARGCQTPCGRGYGWVMMRF